MTVFDSVVCGIYGISGCGKSYALARISKARPEWRCMDGSEVIRELTQEHGVSWCDFVSLEDKEQDEYRALAAKRLRGFQGVTLVAGHCSFLQPREGELESNYTDVFSKADGETYNVIFYLDDKEPHQIFQQRKSDNLSGSRLRPEISEEAIKAWILHDKEALRQACNEHDIKLITISEGSKLLSQIEDFLASSFTRSQERSLAALRESIWRIPEADVFLLMDGDRTLCPQDTGKIFVERIRNIQNGAQLICGDGDAEARDPLKKIFQRYPEYCFDAFLACGIWYNRILDTSQFREVCRQIAELDIAVFPQMLDFLKNKLPSTVHPILVSSGTAEIWRNILAQVGLSSKMSIIAGNHIGLEPYIIDGCAKGEVVKRLKEIYPGCHVWAFGDSAVDSVMFDLADRAFIVLDDRRNRSLQHYLKKRIESRRHLSQLRLSTETGDPDTYLHPGVVYQDLDKLAEELNSGNMFQTANLASRNGVARVLATQSRRSDLSGPTLQQVHIEAGKILADRLMEEDSGFLDVAEFGHVQGNIFEGAIPASRVLILPLMRGGEPMARGIFERFPGASLVHYEDHDDSPSRNRLMRLLTVPKQSSDCIRRIVVVDSVVNEGNSVRRVMDQLANVLEPLHPSLPRPRIFVLTLVMQEASSLALPKEYPRVRFIALRVSQNKYKGKGGTDTGNRLFGTI